MGLYFKCQSMLSLVLGLDQALRGVETVSYKVEHLLMDQFQLESKLTTQPSSWQRAKKGGGTLEASFLAWSSE